MHRPNLKKVADFHGHRDCIYTLSPSFHPGKILSAGAEGIIAEWTIEHQEAKGLARVDSPIYSLLLIPERGYLLAGTRDGELLFLDMEDGKIISRIQAHQAGIFDLQFFPGKEWVLAAAGDGALSVWRLDQPKLDHLTQIASKSVRTLCFDPQGRSLFAGSSDNKIRRFTLDLNLDKEWSAHDFSVFRLLFSPDNKYLISGSRDARIRLWDVHNDFAPHVEFPAHMYAINDVILSPDGSMMFSGSMDKSIKVWNTENWKLQRVVDHARNQNHKNGINRLLWHEGHLFSCGDDRLVMQWKLV